MNKSEIVNEITDYYRSNPHANHKRWHLKPKERQMLEDRIKEGYTLEELKMAIDGLHMTAWNRGENPSGKKYLGLYYALHEDKIDTRIQAKQDHLDLQERADRNEHREREKDAQRAKSRREMMDMPNISAELRKAMRSN